MTTFVFCRGCAHQIHETAQACPKWTDQVNTNHVPMLMLLGEKDNLTPAKDCVAYADELNREHDLGIQYKIYKGAYQAFDTRTPFHSVPGAETAQFCNIEARLTDTPGSGLGEAVDLNANKKLVSFDDLNKAFCACKSNKGFSGGGKQSAEEDAVKDVRVFLQGVFTK